MNDKGAVLVVLDQNNKWTFPSGSSYELAQKNLSSFVSITLNGHFDTVKMNNKDEIRIYKNVNIDKNNIENVGFLTWTGNYIVVKDANGMFAKYADSFPLGHMTMYLKVLNLIN